ncbi:hypothetical protein T229_14925 [Tannerella sp. oral taxon BU063 isolate Cell 5]|uniref:AAA domain-containing protein n=1 Tax=Tannerella sp. oral taxon BU063 isolate Cell 5 TaxID=1410950 RepID=W2C8D6_9BACT|nr:hypothetical protein T229_14925 [Tannerella sp. oral taxon BU063 isolate Cell 5]
MTTIEIRNVGPIKEVPEITLNSVNVFMGPQSSGKSTIAKIISYCTWLEKEMATSHLAKEYALTTRFKDELESFHKIKGYFRADSYIRYQSDVVEIIWSGDRCYPELINRLAYQRSKIAYIPSERNMVILPEARRVELGSTNVRSFLFDWFTAREKCTDLPILDLGVNYRYVEAKEEDHIQGGEGDSAYDILLSNASSGLQSLTPLLVMIEYLTKWIYEEERLSFEQESKRKETAFILMREILLGRRPNQLTSFSDQDDLKSFLNKLLDEKDPDATKLFNEYSKHITSLLKTHNSQFIIEEPEMNLFPETQRDLVFHLLNRCLEREGNRLTITTHSHYILYALNNCMMAGLVYDKMDDGLKERLKCGAFRVDPSYISIYEIREGVVKRIQKEDGLIRDNYFDQQMKTLMNDFYLMLNYYS